MSDIKPLDNNEKTVTTLAILGGLLLFFLALTQCDGTAKFLPLGKADADLSDASLGALADDNLSGELAELSQKNQAANENINELQSDLNNKDQVIATLEEELESTQDKVDGLNKKVNRLNSSLSDKDAILPAKAADPEVVVDNSQVNELEDALKATKKENEALTNRVTALEGSLQGKEAKLEEQKRKIQGLNTANDALSRTKQESEAKLNDKLNALSSSIKTGETNDVVKQEVAKVEVEWKGKLDKLKVQHEMDKAKYTNNLKSELNNLRVALRKEKTKKVFANTSDDLAPSAQKLIKNLGDYKGESTDDLKGLYKNIDSSIGSRPKLVVNFASGSSAVSADYQAKIDALLKGATPNSYFMAVGYADNTGSAAANKSLSSKRATRVAEVVKPLLGDSQFVQAFYLGQTERFGAPENNRVVEIWEINE